MRFYPDSFAIFFFSQTCYIYYSLKIFLTRSVALIPCTSCLIARCVFYLKLARLIPSLTLCVRYRDKFAVCFFFFFFLRESTVALCTNRSCSAGLAQYWQANNVTTLVATKVNYGLLVVGKQRNSTVSLNVTRYRRGVSKKRGSSNVPVYNRYFSWAFAPLLRSYFTTFT